MSHTNHLAATMTPTTTPRHIWMQAIELAAIELGISAEWLRDVTQRDRLNRAYNVGEPAWMALDAMRQFWAGKQRAERESADGFSHIRAAAKAATR